MTSPERPGLLRRLTTLQHLLFAALLGVSVVRAWQHGADRVWLVAGTLTLLGWYAVGAARAGHQARERSRSTPGPHAGLWLAGLALLWGLLVLLSSDFVWVGFALWLLAAHLLPLAMAGLFSAVVLAVVIGAPVLEGRPWTAAGVVGPAVGALFALALARGQVLLARESGERALLVDSLVAAQAETAALHEELLATQREAGALTERTRLSRDIHDTLAQGFSSILLLARGASVTEGEAELRRLIWRIEETAATNLDEARIVVGALAPKTLADSGLVASLRRLLDDLADDTDIEVALKTDDGLPALPMATEVALLRIAQGALANVRQHAAAGRVVVTLSASDDHVRLDVVDDGIGFDPEGRRHTPSELSRGGYGLASTTARLAELGGGLDVASAPGDGTAVSAYLPLSETVARRT